jgi:trehalose synthase
VTSLVIEQFHAPDTHRRALRLESVRRRAADQLAGRSVWCIGAAPLETDAADALQRCLRPVRADGVASQRRSLQLGEPLIGLMERLDAMLRGVTMLGPALGSGEEDAYLKGRADADALIPAEVQAGDVVVLHDPIAAALATAIRERGAHAIWRTSIGRWESNAAAAWRFLHRSAPALDAYIAAWRSERTGSLGGPALAAYISAPGVVSAKAVDVTGPDQRAAEICWTTLLADVVRDDRAERVGGTVQARPSVAAR